MEQEVSDDVRTRYGFRLNGVDIADIAPEIIVLDVGYDAPAREVKTTRLAERDGQIVTGTNTSSQSVSIQFEIHTQDILRRAQVLDDVRRWALKGGWLTTDDMRGKRLSVVCESPPALSSSLKWTQRLTATFAAYACPYWEDDIPMNITISGNGRSTIYVPGCAAPAGIEVTVTNVGSAAISRVSMAAGDTAMEFDRLSLAAGKTLEIGHDQRGMLYARIDGTSVLGKRTAQSHDDLILEPGKQAQIVVNTNGTARARFLVRGRY